MTLAGILPSALLLGGQGAALGLALETLRTAFGMDWQFFVVTAVALGALVLLVRTVLPGSFGDDSDAASPSCDHCPSGCGVEASTPREERLVTLGSSGRGAKGG